MNVLLLSHQLDFSGAPIALLRLAETMIAQGHSVALLSLKNGPLGADFVKLGVKQFNTLQAHNYDLYFANTFLTVPTALKLAPSSEKILAWIHESRHFFKLYGVDENKFGLSQLKRAVFPAAFMLEEYRDLMPHCGLGQLRNFVSMRGIEPIFSFSDCYAVTGSWELRKNQVALVKHAEQTLINIRFNFIGANKPPSITDTRHHFCGQVPVMLAKALIAGSSGLISAAQSEAQPLTVIESAMSGKPVLLSDIAAHRELKQLIPSIVTFDSKDAESFKAAFEAISQQTQRELKDGARLAEMYFGHSAFDHAIRKLTH